jgi:hypothetical protein
MRVQGYWVICGALLAPYALQGQTPPPLTCNLGGLPPALVRAEGRAELVSDLLLVCTGGSPSLSTTMNVSLFLNTNITSNLTGPGPDETEALILIDEPKPAPTLNTSNGLPFPGQVKGIPGVLASGNVFTGLRTGGANQILFPGIPIVPPGAGTRVFRITNIRALPVISAALGPSSILAFIAVSGPSPITVANPVQTVGFAQNGLTFSYSPAAGGLNLQFIERYPSAFKKRMESSAAGPLAWVKQNQPGIPHCTESGFNPDFTGVAPGATGSANTGTRLVATFTGIPGAVTFLFVPDLVTSGSGKLQAGRVPPPSVAPFADGTPLTAPGFTAIPVAGGTATLVYEVMATSPYAGVDGCLALDNFQMTVFPVGGPFANTTVTGSFAPVHPAVVINGPAPEPRFF